MNTDRSVEGSEALSAQVEAVVVGAVERFADQFTRVSKFHTYDLEPADAPPTGDPRLNKDPADRPHGHGVVRTREDCKPFIYDAGTLVIDLVDARTNRVVWRGWSEGTVDGVVDNQRWMEGRIDDDVTRIFKQLPSRIR
jgi:hypothetical protein